MDGSEMVNYAYAFKMNSSKFLRLPVLVTRWYNKDH